MAPNGQLVAEGKRAGDVEAKRQTVQDVKDGDDGDKDASKTLPGNDSESGSRQVDTHLKLPKEIGTDYGFKRQIVWFNAIGFLALHLCGLVGLCMCVNCHVLTIVWMILFAFLGGEGVTIGAHRLYSHKAFKATLPLRFVLIILQTIAGQNCMYVWVRDHRQHHKYSDTDADPHNAHRGFFFSHMGWLMSKKHPAVISKGRTIDMSDLEADPLVMFQKLFYKPLYIIFALALPVGIPVGFWNESYINSFFVAYFARYVIQLNFTWLVNSAAHMYGNKPYDKEMKPVESAFVSYVSLGEGWHNYHHAFPWDYRAAELGFRYSLTTFIIDGLANLGLAYDLRTTSPQMIEKRVYRTGDGSHPIDAEIRRCGNNNNNNNNNNGSENVEARDKKTIKTMENDNEDDEDDGNLKTHLLINDEDLKGVKLIKRPIAVQG